MPGPAPDPNALRRDRKSDPGWTTLPSTPRVGLVPEWPLSGVAKGELELWVELWRKPQAHLWALNGQEREVAIYVRSWIENEAVGAPVTLRVLVQKLADALLLTIPAMHKARVKIAADEVAVKRSAQPLRKLSASERLRARNVEVG